MESTSAAARADLSPSGTQTQVLTVDDLQPQVIFNSYVVRCVFFGLLANFGKVIDVPIVDRKFSMNTIFGNDKKKFQLNALLSNIFTRSEARQCLCLAVDS